MGIRGPLDTTLIYIFLDTVTLLTTLTHIHWHLAEGVLGDTKIWLRVAKSMTLTAHATSKILFWKAQCADSFSLLMNCRSYIFEGTRFSFIVLNANTTDGGERHGIPPRKTVGPFTQKCVMATGDIQRPEKACHDQTFYYMTECEGEEGGRN